MLPPIVLHREGTLTLKLMVGMEGFHELSFGLPGWYIYWVGGRKHFAPIYNSISAEGFARKMIQKGRQGEAA